LSYEDICGSQEGHRAQAVHNENLARQPLKVKPGQISIYIKARQP